MHNSNITQWLRLHLMKWFNQYRCPTTSSFPDRVLELSAMEPRVLLSAAPLPMVTPDASPVAALELDNSVPELHGDTSLAEKATPGSVTEETSELRVPKNAAGLSEQDDIRRLVFLDDSINDLELLIADLQRSNETHAPIEMFLLDSSEEGITEVGQVLESGGAVSEMHFVTHGTEGRFAIGESWITAYSLPEMEHTLSQWNEHLHNDAKMFIYGCDVASTEAGKSFLNHLGQTVGMDVSASTDRTGSAILGGDWELEYSTAEEPRRALFSRHTQSEWQGLLGVITVNQTMDVVNGDTTTIDSLLSNDGDDGISLREAIIATNNTPGTDHVFLGEGTFQLSLPGSGEDAGLTGDLDITDNLFIHGAGSSRTILDAGGIDRMFDVIGSNRQTLNVLVEGMRIQNGLVNDIGGGLRIENSEVVLRQVHLTQNHATFGGGIVVGATGSLVISDSTIESNSAFSGGGILNEGSVELDGVTVNGNLAEAGSGGGVLSSGQRFSAVNTTISGNTASAQGGGLAVVTGHRVAELRHVTVAFNQAGSEGGGLYSPKGTRVGNSLFSGNTAGTAADVSGSVRTINRNLYSDALGFSGLGNDDITDVDPQLTPLGDLGGSTRTHGLPLGSIAIDAGVPVSDVLVDQRGYERNVASDLGAFERQSFDVNEHAPVILAGQSFEIQEDAIGGTVIGTVIAEDPDPASNLLDWKITAGDPEGLFQIGESTGQICLALDASLDAELESVYSLTVTVSDGVFVSNPQTVTVNVVDVNESGIGPISDVDIDPNAVEENSASASPVGITVYAEDRDTSDEVSYSLLSDGGGRFSIDPTSGVVCTTETLDAEVEAGYEIRVLASSTDGTTSEASFQITIVDVNEFALSPISDSDPMLNRVVETAGIGTLAGIQASAVDKDATTNGVAYELLESSNGLFTIDSSTGIVSVNGSLDFETSAEHLISIRATSDDGSSSVENFIVQVVDANEHVPEILAGQNFDIREDAIGGTVLGDVAAVDVDGTSVLSNWVIVDGDPNGLFRVDALTGHLSIASDTLLEAETTTLYALTMTVSDGLFTSSPQIVNVTVLDVDEFDVGPISDVDGSVNAIAENSTANSSVGLTVLARDADVSDEVSYSLLTDGEGRFTIGLTTGIVRTTKLLNAETGQSYDIQVLATSTDGSKSEATFRISILDVNEFSLSSISNASTALEHVFESADVGSSIGIQAFAVDMDATTNGVMYELLQSSDGLFVIDSGNGVVTLNGELDYETSAEHFISVRATSDDGSFSVADYRVEVANVIEPAPTIYPGQQFELVVEADSVYPVGLIRFDDLGISAGPLTWELVDAGGNPGFSVDPGSGQIVMRTGAVNAGESLVADLQVRVGHLDGWGPSESVTIISTGRSTIPLPGVGNGGRPGSSIPPPGLEEGDGGEDPVIIVIESSRNSLVNRFSVFSRRVDRGDAATAMNAAFLTDVEQMETMVQLVFGGMSHSGGTTAEDAWAGNRAPLLNSMGAGFLSVSDSTDNGLMAMFVSEASDVLNPDGRLFQGEILVGLAAGATMGLSVGYLLWFLRGISLVSFFASAAPVWTMFDPIPILTQPEISERGRKKETLVEITKGGEASR